LEKLKEITDRTKDALADISGENKLKDLASEERELLDELMNAAKKSDKNELATVAKKLQNLQDRLDEQAKIEAKKEDDPIRKKQILDAISEMDTLLPQEIHAAQKLAENPRDKSAQDNAQNVDDKLRDALDRLDPSSSHGLASKSEDLVDQLVNAAKKGDKKRVDELTKAFVPTTQELETQGKIQAKHTDDPIKKKRIEDAVDELELLMPEFVASTKQLAEKPNDKDQINKVDNLSKQIKELVNEIGGVAPTTFEQEQNLRDLEKSSENGNGPEVENDLKKIRQSQNQLGAQTRSELKDEQDPKKKQKTNEALQHIEQLLPLQEQAARKLVQNANDQKAKDELKNIDDEIRLDLGQIRGEGLQTAAKQIEKDLQDLNEAAKKKETNQELKNFPKKLLKNKKN